MEAQVTESFTISTLIPATPLRVYEAWLDGREHGAFTGGKAEVEPGIGGAFTAWDGYIRGRTLELAEGQRILQSWRTTEFPIGSEDSLLELLLEEAPGGTRITLRHTGIPEGQGASYQEGWGEHYFDRMKRYFGGASARPAGAKPKAKAKAKPKSRAKKPKAKAKAKTSRRASRIRRPARKAARRVAKRSRPASRKPKKRVVRKPTRKSRRR
jgi:uncharacterized protein YndB with AHSA1/START domain